MATKIERVLAPSRGLNTFDGPSAIPRDMAPELRNLVPGSQGKIVPRAGLTAVPSNTAIYSWMVATGIAAASCGTLALDDYIVSSGPNIVVSSGGRAGMMYDPGGGMFGAVRDYGAMTLARLGGGATLASTHYAYNRSVSPSIMNALTSTGATAFSTNAPRNGTYTFSYLDTLWVFGARDTPAGSTTDQPSALYYVNPGTTPADTVAAWQTDGITNKIIVGEDSTNDRAVAAIPFNRTLLLFKANSLWQLVGTSPENFEVRKIADVGCIDLPVATSRSVYWAAPSGEIMQFDGASVRPAFYAMRDVSGYSSYITLFGHDQLLLHFRSQSYIYDEGLGTFFEIDLTINDHDPASTTIEKTNPLDLQRPVRTFRYVSSWGPNVTLVGPNKGGRYALYYVPYTFPYRLSDPAYDVGPINLADATYGGGQTALTMSWTSRTIRPVSPNSKVRLSRLFVDYKCPVWEATAYDTLDDVVNDADAPAIWYAQIESEDGTVLLAPTPLPGQGSASSGVDRRRQIIDLGGVEASEYKVNIYSLAGTNLIQSSGYVDDLPLPYTAEIHDVWVEYEEAQRRVAV